MSMRRLMRQAFPTKAVFCILALLFVGTLTPAAATYRVVDRTDILYHKVTGDGRSSSFLDRGVHLLQEVDLEHETALNDVWNSKLLSSFRYTDSDQFDTERLSIERLSWTVKSEDAYLTLGDYFANFSQYSLNKSLKGVGCETKFGAEDSYVRATYGTFDGQWEYLYDTIDSEPVTRMGAGLRLQHSLDGFRYGLNLVRIDDFDRDGKKTNQDVYRQTVPAIDWEYRGDKHKLSGEHAYSETVRTSATGVDDRTYGGAHRLTLYSRINPLKVRIKLERVTPDFLSFGGGATADRKRIYLKTDFKLSKKFTAFIQYDYYRNNIDGQLTTTTRNTAGELGMKMKKLFGRKSLSMTTSFRHKVTTASNDTVDQSSDRFKLGLKDKFFRVLRVDGDYEVIFDEDDVADKSPINRLYNLSLVSRHRLDDGTWQLRPKLRLSRQETENTTSGGDDLTNQLNFALSANRGNATEMGLSFDRTSTDPFDTTQDNSTTLRYDAYLQLATDLVKNGRIRCNLSRNEFDFSDSSKNYEELIAKLSLNFDFDR